MSDKGQGQTTAELHEAFLARKTTAELHAGFIEQRQADELRESGGAPRTIIGSVEEGAGFLQKVVRQVVTVPVEIAGALTETASGLLSGVLTPLAASTKELADALKPVTELYTQFKFSDNLREQRKLEEARARAFARQPTGEIGLVSTPGKPVQFVPASSTGQGTTTLLLLGGGLVLVLLFVGRK